MHDKNPCSSCGGEHWLGETCVVEYARRDAQATRRLYEEQKVHRIEMLVTALAEMVVRCTSCELSLYVVMRGSPRPLDDMLLAVQRHMSA